MRKRLLIATASVAALVVWLIPPQASGSSGQRASGQSAGPQAPAVIPTFHTFTTTLDGGTTVRITPNGNVYSYESPTGFEHINAGTVIEGYVLCYTPSGGSPTNAYDVLDLTSGFGAATHTTVAPWTVTRKTSDGKVSLKQVFAFNGTEKALTVTMTVKNLTGATVSAITLRRQVDFDIDGAGASGWDFGFQNWFAATANAAFAWNDPATSGGNPAHGMILRHLKGGPHTPQWTNFLDDTSCTVAGGGGTTPDQSDHGATISYSMGNLSAGASRSETVEYVRD